MTQTPAGWYPHATQPGLEMYWDGSRWSDQRTAAPPLATPSAAPAPTSQARVDPTFAWTVALLPLALIVVEYLAPGVASSALFLLGVVAVTIALCILDMRRLAAANIDPPSGAAVFVVPVYLILRTTRARSTPAIPVAWFLSFGLSVLAAFTINSSYTYDSGAVENEISTWFDRTQQAPGVSVACPDDPSGRVGDTFRCTASDQTGTVPVVVTITDGGSYTWVLEQPTPAS